MYLKNMNKLQKKGVNHNLNYKFRCRGRSEHAESQRTANMISKQILVFREKAASTKDERMKRNVEYIHKYLFMYIHT